MKKNEYLRLRSELENDRLAQIVWDIVVDQFYVVPLTIHILVSTILEREAQVGAEVRVLTKEVLNDYFERFCELKLLRPKDLPEIDRRNYVVTTKGSQFGPWTTFPRKGRSQNLAHT